MSTSPLNCEIVLTFKRIQIKNLKIALFGWESKNDAIQPFIFEYYDEI